MQPALRILALLAFALAPNLRADTIELTDGRKITGTLSRSGDVITIKSDDGKTITAKPAEIAKITLTSTVTPAEAAANDWSRLGRQVKAADELQAVIDLYKQYLDKYPAAQPSDEARSTVAVYETMVHNDPVKFRGRWMPRAQVGVVIKQWTDAARPALDLYKTGRMKQTLDAVKTILADDNQNPDALTLAGLAAYRTNNLPQARTYFTSLAAADPGSLLAENNLAVISTGQKQVGEAFQHYVKALQIMPGHRLLLDNVAEALYAYTTAGGDKTGAAYRALVKAYEPAETRLEETMGQSGQIRWGATWVGKDQRARLTKAQDALRDQIANLDSLYASIRRTLAGLDTQIRQAAADIDSDTQTIASCEARVLAAQGFRVDVSYYAALRDAAAQNRDRTSRYQAQLQMQYDQLASGTKDFIDQAQKLKAAFTAGGMVGQYSGNQRIIDLGETDNPPSPASVIEPTIPVVQMPPIMVNPPPEPTPPVLVPIPTGVPVLVPVPR